MSHISRADFDGRDALLKLLTDDEVARVSTEEAASSLTAGQEYLDLQHLDQGVLAYDAGSKVEMGHVLPRHAVGAATWTKIIAHLTH
jgi:hypothetical protein